MNVLIKEINDIIEKNNSKINENIVGINYLEKLKYLVIDSLKDGQDKFILDDLVAALTKKNNQSIKFQFKNRSLFLSINLYKNPLSKISYTSCPCLIRLLTKSSHSCSKLVSPYIKMTGILTITENNVREAKTYISLFFN